MSENYTTAERIRGQLVKTKSGLQGVTKGEMLNGKMVVYLPMKVQHHAQEKLIGYSRMLCTRETLEVIGYQD